MLRTMPGPYWLSIQLVSIVITISVIIIMDKLEGHRKDSDILPGSDEKLT